jgi:hypothetical protein
VGPFRQSSGDHELSTGDPEDDKILRIIAQNSPLAQPRHWVHTLCFEDEGAARAAAGMLANLAGPPDSMPGRPAAERAWVTEVTADPDAGWVVTAEQDGVVLSADLVRQVRELFTELEKLLPGIVYDGWRASL